VSLTIYPPVSSGGAVWGDITGTLSDQTDLQSALDAKASLSQTVQIVTVTGIATDVGTKQNLLSAVPTGKQRIVTKIVVRNASADLTAFGGEDGFYFGYNAGATGSSNLTFGSNAVAALTTTARLIQTSGDTFDGAGYSPSVVGAAGEVFGISVGFTSIAATVVIDVHYYDVTA